MSFHWIYCYEKCSEAMRLMLSPRYDHREAIAIAYKDQLIHLRDENIPEECKAEYLEFKKLFEKYRKIDQYTGVNFYNVKKSSLERITSAYADFFLGFLRVYHEKRGALA
ncbi:hypothetical protein [Pannonibacter tanglangensis]|uniref:HEPN domain-containing protein n=1 Tax=Pannonibacter tanglangensis TaxID=2750084 RepID=A0ABW9ZHS0_9HYPH|nr:hypothetical protein [Pannonibacter sp. XCT-34]NBN64415.1 hypothetical protein [Pannonibacter sp. XCT-34]